MSLTPPLSPFGAQPHERDDIYPSVPADPFDAPITLEVYGLPQTQGSKTAFLHKQSQKVVMTEGKTPAAREKFKSWRQGVTGAATEWQSAHNVPLLDAACRVTVTFRLPRPKSAPKRVTLPATGLDIDKLARAVLDSITGVLITNDSRVCELVARKVFATERPPGATITLEKM